jgi:hypothetical protein
LLLAALARWRLGLEGGGRVFLKRPIDPAWAEIAAKIVIPKRGKVVISHDAFRVDEEKAVTPDPLKRFPIRLTIS